VGEEVIHILTLNWNAKDTILALKNSLELAFANMNYTWHIKDNGSTDGSVEMMKNWKVNLIDYKSNKDNYSQGMNFLFKEASPKDDDVVITLNNDVVFTDQKSIKNILKIVEDKYVGLVGCKLNFLNTKLIQHAGVLFHPRLKTPYHINSGDQEKVYNRQNRIFPAVTGALSALKASTFRQLYKNTSGMVGFNENLNWMFDDIDMCLRIGNHLNKKIVMCGECNIFHEESKSLKKNPVNKLFGSQSTRLFLNEWFKVIEAYDCKKFLDPKHNLYLGKK
jgi:GT2 family glycosyltransferase